MIHHRLGRHWELFRRTILAPAGATAHQVREMRRAFYAGAASCFEVQIREIAALSDEDAERAMSALNDEFVEFGEAIRKGRA